MAPLLAQRPRVDRAFERLYRRHVADVYHYALAVLRNPSDAEDVTQTAFLNAYSAYRRGERPGAPRNWLIAIAHNVCRQRFRQSARRPHEVALDEDFAETLVSDDRPSAQDIRIALGHLAFNQRAALVMRELEGRSYAEIAEVLAVSVSAVETLIFRARRALREQLEGSLTCRQAELALSRQLDGRLPRPERGALRAHLRACPECASFARSQRAQRAALRSIATLPLPSSLASFFGGGAAAGSALTVKAAAVIAVGAVVTGVGYEGAKRLPFTSEEAKVVQAGAQAGDAASGRSADATRAGGVMAGTDVFQGLAAVARGRDADAGAAANGSGAKKGHAAARSDTKTTNGKARGRPQTPPGRARTAAAKSRARGGAHRSTAGAPRGRTKEKHASTASGRGEAGPARPKPEPPGQENKTVLPPVPQPSLPPAPPVPPPPDVPIPGKSK